MVLDNVHLFLIDNNLLFVSSKLMCDKTEISNRLSLYAMRTGLRLTNTINFSGFVWSSLRADPGLIRSNTFNRTKSYNHFFLSVIVIITLEIQCLPSLIEEILFFVGRNSKQGASEKNYTRQCKNMFTHILYTRISTPLD